MLFNPFHRLRQYLVQVCLRNFVRDSVLSDRIANASIELPIDSARACLAAGRLTEAEQQLCELLRQYPSCASAYYLLAEIYRLNGNIEQALLYAKKAAVIDGQRTAHLELLAELYFIQAQWSAALAMYDTILRLAVNYAEIWARRGRALFMLHRHDESRLAFERAMSLDPNNLTVLELLAITDLDRGELALAAEHYRRLAELSPEPSYPRKMYLDLLRSLDPTQADGLPTPQVAGRFGLTVAGGVCTVSLDQARTQQQYLAPPLSPIGLNCFGQESIRYLADDVLVAESAHCYRYLLGVRWLIVGGSDPQTQMRYPVPAAAVLVVAKVGHRFGCPTLTMIYVSPRRRLQGLATQLVEVAQQYHPDLMLDGRLSRDGQRFFHIDSTEKHHAPMVAGLAA